MVMPCHAHVQLPPREELDRLLSKTKISLFQNTNGAAFLSVIMCSVTFHWDESIDTAATNGKSILWNPYFFMAIPKEERLFVLVHELWHIAYLHVQNIGNRDPRIHNIAADHVINTKLVSEGYKTERLGFEIYADMFFKDWSTDRVYEYLMNNPPPPMSGGAGLSDDVKPSQDPSPTDKMDAIGTLVQASQASRMAGEHGVVPGEIEQLIETFLNPVLPWEVLLQNWLTQFMEEDYTYRKPNRRFSNHDDPIMPSLQAEEGALQELNWYIDVSGSISNDMLYRFFSEMKYVKDTYHPEKINIIQFDCVIQKVTEIDEEDDFSSLLVVGRGGTDLAPVREHILETNPTAAIIFSDMECDPMKEVNTPIVWAVFDSGYGHTPEFGEVIKIRE